MTTYYVVHTETYDDYLIRETAFKVFVLRRNDEQKSIQNLDSK